MSSVVCPPAIAQETVSPDTRGERLRAPATQAHERAGSRAAAPAFEIIDALEQSRCQHALTHFSDRPFRWTERVLEKFHASSPGSTTVPAVEEWVGIGSGTALPPRAADKGK
jgi:hypothetical protein